MTADQVNSSGTRHDTRSRRRFGARDLALVAVFAALIVALGLPGPIYAVGIAVPFTLQNLGVMLAGAVLGWRRGAAAALLVIVLCAVGLPVLAGGRGGLGVFMGPTVGYLLAWAPAAAVIGAFAQWRAPRFSTAWTAVGVVLGGIVLVHVVGILGMMLRADLPFDLAVVTDLAFVPGDAVKAVLTLVIAAAVHRAVPGLLAGTTRSTRR